MSHSIHTRILDPIFSSKNRAEFRLDRDTLYSSDMRLLNVGFSTSPAGKKNNYLLGAEGVIQSIQLYDGNEVLSQILEASVYTAFKNQLKSNDTNISKSKQLKHNSLGFLAQGNQTWTTGNPNKTAVTVATQQSGQNTVGKLAHISLRDCLPFLRSQMAVPTNVFQRLRLVINFKTSDELKYLQSDRALVDLLPNTGVQLVADELTGRGSPDDMKMREQMMMGYKGASWQEVEHDSVEVPVVAGLTGDSTVRQENTFLVTGFNEKSLRRLLLVSSPTDAGVWLKGGTENRGVSNQGSIASFSANWQIRCNGSNLFSGNGWTGPNRRLGHLADTYGPSNLSVGGNLTYLESADRVLADPADWLSVQDYTGCRVDERVMELKVSFARTGVQGTANLNPTTATTLRLNMYGEVDKAIVMTGKDEYEIVYA